MENGKRDLIKTSIENILKNKSSVLQDAYSKSLEELVEELKIYQYELEFQNEELIRSQAEIESSRNEYADLYQNAPLGYVVLTDDLHIIDCNRTFYQLLDVNEKYVHHDFRRFIQPAFQDQFHFFWTDLIKFQEVKPIDIQLLKSTGEPLFVQIHGMLKNKKQRNEIRLAVTDISERKNLEKKHFEINELLAQMSRIAHVGGWNLDLINRKLTWTEETYRIHEVDEHFKPDLDNAIAFYTFESKPVLEQAMKRARDFGEPFDIELTFISAKGKHLWIRAIGKPERVADTTVRISGVFQDITQQKFAEQTIRDANKILEERVAERTSQLEISNKQLSNHLKELEQYNFFTSHDLQEPILSLINHAKFLHEEYNGKLDEYGNQSLEFISASATNLRIMVKGLLDYALLGKDCHPKHLECKLIVNEVMEELSDVIKSSNASITLGSLPPVYCCPNGLKLLFRHLIINAVTFVPKNTIPVIRIQAEKGPSEYRFSVEDNGIGIVEKNYDKVFLMFKRLHNHHEYSGYGIGLALCKKIIDMHGGQIWVESVEGTGSRFIFTLPDVS